ncbi:MAG: redoxin domain-containing protein [Acidobacteria bacterium]|nr:redoxin domain-containing protein [Acidobacteriota bacterium]
MKKLLFLSFLATTMFAQDGKTHLKVGDAAPEFAKLSSSVPGKSFSLGDFKGKKTVVLAFFPLAFTGG